MMMKQYILCVGVLVQGTILFASTMGDGSVSFFLDKLQQNYFEQLQGAIDSMERLAVGARTAEEEAAYLVAMEEQIKHMENYLILRKQAEKVKFTDENLSQWASEMGKEPTAFMKYYAQLLHQELAEQAGLSGGKRNPAHVVNAKIMELYFA